MYTDMQVQYRSSGESVGEENETETGCILGFTGIVVNKGRCYN